MHLNWSALSFIVFFFFQRSENVQVLVCPAELNKKKKNQQSELEKFYPACLKKKVKVPVVETGADHCRCLLCEVQLENKNIFEYIHTEISVWFIQVIQVEAVEFRQLVFGNKHIQLYISELPRTSLGTPPQLVMSRTATVTLSLLSYSRISAKVCCHKYPQHCVPLFFCWGSFFFFFKVIFLMLLFIFFGFVLLSGNKSNGANKRDLKSSVQSGVSRTAESKGKTTCVVRCGFVAWLAPRPEFAALKMTLFVSVNKKVQRSNGQMCFLLSRVSINTESEYQPASALCSKIKSLGFKLEVTFWSSYFRGFIL